MKIVKCLLSSVLFFICLLPVSSQNIVAIVSYMKVPTGGVGNYLEVEQDYWKPMHQEWANEGNLLAWYLFRVPYPGGTEAPYHFVTVHLYPNMEQAGSTMGNMSTVFAKVHPGKDMNDVMERTLASRDLTRTYMTQRWKAFSDPDLEEMPTIQQMVYFEVPMDKWQDYMEMEEKYFHPTHQAEIDAGYRAGWSGWIMQMPFGEDQPFQFAAVDVYKDWEQYSKNIPASVYEGVISEEDYAKRNELFAETVTLKYGEIWRLVDYVLAPSSTGTNE